MRFLYVDVDTLRPDHLHCYGYPRETSPNIDAVAATGARFTDVYASDTPCLPSRTALATGKFGIRTGVVGHGGTAADLSLEGSSRGFRTRTAVNGWVERMRSTGMRTATISSFAARHSAYHWLAGFSDAYDVGLMGEETADVVTPLVLEWLERHGREDDWFLHVHLWDPHTPYRTPEHYGDPFADAPAPDWPDEATRARHWELPGPHTAQEVLDRHMVERLESLGASRRQPVSVPTLAELRQIVDGYDTGVHFADAHVGRILNELDRLGVLDSTAVMVSGDHGETLGELGIYCDHQTADYQTTRVPMVIRWPGEPALSGGKVHGGLCYQIDVAATALELLGAEVPGSWDGRSFATRLRAGGSPPRDHLVMSTAAWTAQRAVRFGDWVYIRTYHDGYHGFVRDMLFDVAEDPHERANLATEHPDLVAHASAVLAEWHDGAMDRSASAVDPMWRVLREGGPWHVRNRLDHFVGVLRQTGREAWAAQLSASKGRPAGPPPSTGPGRDG